MLFEDIEVAATGSDRVEVRARWGGEDLYYRLPAARFHRPAIGDALALSVLVPAMVTGTDIRLPDAFPVSSHLAANLAGIQRIFVSWNPRLKSVRLDAARRDAMPAEGPVGLFYAGGVDSSYSLISHRDELGALVVVFGFDFTLSDSQIAESVERNRRLAAGLGKDLLPAETNHSRFVRKLGVSRTFAYITTLASIAHLLGLRRCYVASSHWAANVRPDGSNPVLDPRLSNGATEIVHDDASVGRVEKTRAIARDPLVLENLRVCWEDANRNCGACPKCVRTMTALRLCGTGGPFPPLKDLAQVRRMAATTEPEFVIDMVLAAHAKGDAGLLRALKRGLRSNDRREALRYLDRALTGGWIQRMRRRFRRPETRLVQVDLRPDLAID